MSLNFQQFPKIVSLFSFLSLSTTIYTIVVLDYRVMESTRLQFWRSSFLVAVVIVYNICCRNFEEENAPCFFQARPHHRLQVDGDGAQVTNYWILPLSLTVSSPLLCGLLLTRCLHLFNIVPKEADLLRSSMTAWNELTKANRFKKKKKKRDKTQTLLLQRENKMFPRGRCWLSEMFSERCSSEKTWCISAIVRYISATQRIDKNRVSTRGFSFVS